MKPKLLRKKTAGLVNLHSKAPWDKSKALDTHRFVRFDGKGLGRLRLTDSLCQCFGQFFAFKRLYYIFKRFIVIYLFIFITS